MSFHDLLQSIYRSNIQRTFDDKGDHETNFYHDGYLCLRGHGVNHESLLFDELDSALNLYRSCTKIRIDTDSVFHPFPEEIKKFQMLKSVHLHGTRWFYLNCSQLPNTIETLDVTKQNNLSPTFCEGIENLTGLKDLHIELNYIDKSSFYDFTPSPDCMEDFQKHLPIPHNSSLENIWIHTDVHTVRYLDKENLIDNVRDAPFMENIRHRIISIEALFVANDYQDQCTVARIRLE